MGEEDQWKGPCTHLQRIDKLMIGNRVWVDLNVGQLKFGWSWHSHTSIRAIWAMDADGKLSIYALYGSRAWMLDTSKVELGEDEKLYLGERINCGTEILLILLLIIISLTRPILETKLYCTRVADRCTYCEYQKAW